MRKSLSTHLSAAGWEPDPKNVSIFHGPNGEQARYSAQSLALTLRDREVGFSIDLSASGLKRTADLAVYLHQAVAEGSVQQWLERLCHHAAVRMGPNEKGQWIPVTMKDHIVTGDKTLALLDTLRVEPGAEAVARAARMSAALTAAGWRDTTTRSTKVVAGQRMLRTTMLRASNGVHRLFYVLTGDPATPEALRWRFEPSDKSSRIQNLLMDATGAGDPVLLKIDPSDRLDTCLSFLIRELPVSTDVIDTIFAMASLTSVYWVDLSIRRVWFGEEDLPRQPALALEEAIAGVRDNPDSGEAWLAAGFATVDSRIHHLAFAAFGRAAELGAGQGLPVFWQGWLLGNTDTDKALALLERAAELGGVTGEAHKLRASLYEGVLHELDKAFEAYEQAVTHAPEHAPTWTAYGLKLAKLGRTQEAAEVLTRGRGFHPENAKLAYYLGYTKCLAGETQAALDCLEAAVRIDPDYATKIHKDPDLAALQGEPRFKALPSLGSRLANKARARANQERAAANRLARESLRPAPLPPGDDNEDVGRLRAAYLTQNIYPRLFRASDLPRAQAAPGLRELLCDIGIARSEKFSPHYGHPSISPYGVKLPAGVDEFLLHVGELGGNTVAVDFYTGEVFQLSKSWRLSYLAPALSTFLIDQCLPNGQQAWNLTAETLDKLDHVDGIGEGGLAVFAENIDKPTRDRLMEFIAEQGALLNTLQLKGTESKGSGLGVIDFTTACPNLRKLHLHNGEFDDSVFRHPGIENLRLRQTKYVGSKRDFTFGAQSKLAQLVLEDCMLDADSMSFGPGSPLKFFEASLDEDFGSLFPTQLEFDSLPNLRSIKILCGAVHWNLTLRGDMPELGSIKQDGLSYGGFTYAVDGASPQYRKHYFSLIRKGKNFISRL